MLYPPTLERLQLRQKKVTDHTFRFDRVKANSLPIFPEDFGSFIFCMTKKGHIIPGHLFRPVYNSVENIQNHPLSRGFDLRLKGNIFYHSPLFLYLLIIEVADETEVAVNGSNLDQSCS